MNQFDLWNQLMKHKYEFVPSDEITIAPGRTVKRIRALVAISVLGVTPGTLGGYIESEKNLAQVYGDAWVSGKLKISHGYFFGMRFGKEKIKELKTDNGDAILWKT